MPLATRGPAGHQHGPGRGRSRGTTSPTQISVTNIGPNDAVNPVVTDTLDANTTYVSSTAALGWATTTTPTTVSFTEPDLVPNATATFTITANVNGTTAAGDGPFQRRRCFSERHPGGCAVRATTTAMVVSQTTTTLISSANPSVFGQAVTFTATVAAVSPGAGVPTGTVDLHGRRHDDRFRHRARIPRA